MKKALLLAAALPLLAAEPPLADYHRQTVELEREQARAVHDSTRREWISPLRLSASKHMNKSSSGQETDTTSLGLSWNQDLFRSGGITYAIQYADAAFDQELLAADAAEAALVKSLYANLLTLRQARLRLEKRKLQVANGEITVRIKRESYEAGAADITELTDALMALNTQKSGLVEEKAVIENLENAVAALTDVPPEKISPPVFTAMDRESYQKARYDLRANALARRTADATYKVSRSAFLPTLALNAEYGTQQADYRNQALTDREGTYYSYGLTLSLPLDPTTGSDLEQRKIDRLRTRVEEATLGAQAASDYADVKAALEQAEAKRSLARENRALYDRLVESARQGVELGDKTPLDLEMLENSRAIEEKEEKIQEIAIQSALLELHFAGL